MILSTTQLATIKYLNNNKNINFSEILNIISPLSLTSFLFASTLLLIFVIRSLILLSSISAFSKKIYFQYNCINYLLSCAAENLLNFSKLRFDVFKLLCEVLI